ncbi:MAG: leucine dehydrogenase, partial [Gammaproteobacteria bacterium]
GGGAERAMDQIEDIYNTLIRIFDLAGKEGIPTFAAANRIAEERIKNISLVKNIRLLDEV